MESLRSFFRMHWDHESADRAVASWSACVFSAAFPRQAAIRQPGRCMERAYVVDAVHWDREPTPNPSQEGNRHDTDECLIPFREGAGVGRFMERANHSPR
jgi:hypothetical protein